MKDSYGFEIGGKTYIFTTNIKRKLTRFIETFSLSSSFKELVGIQAIKCDRTTNVFAIRLRIIGFSDDYPYHECVPTILEKIGQEKIRDEVVPVYSVVWWEHN